MKTNKMHTAAFLIAIIFLCGLNAMAQEESSKKVHLKVLKNDKVTLDTTMWVKTDADSDELKKLIQEFAGVENIHFDVVKAKDHMGIAYVMESAGEECDSVKHKKVWVVESGDITEVEIEHSGGNYVVIKKKVKSGEGEKAEAYAVTKGKDIYVVTSDDIKKGDKDVEIIIKSKDGHVTIGEEDETGTDLEYKIRILEGDEGHNMIIIKEDSGDEKIGVVVKKSDEQVKFISEDGKEVDFVVRKGKHGTVVATKKVTLMKKSGEGEEEVIEVIIEEMGEAEKKAEQSKVMTEEGKVQEESKKKEKKSEKK